MREVPVGGRTGGASSRLYRSIRSGGISSATPKAVAARSALSLSTGKASSFFSAVVRERSSVCGETATSLDDLRSLPRGTRATRTPADLHQHNCIVYTELATRGAWTFTAGPGAPAEVGSQVTVRVEGTLQTNRSEVIRSAVLAFIQHLLAGG